jgi:prophage regulatory protein
MALVVLHGKVKTIMKSPPDLTSRLVNFENQSALRILRRRVVESATGLGRSAIYALMAKGEFPKSVKLTAKAVGWRSVDVEAWIASRNSGAPSGKPLPDCDHRLARQATLRIEGYRVGEGLSVGFSVENNRLSEKWFPRTPTLVELRKIEDRYRKARLQFIEEIARQIGGTVACVEVPHDC